METGIAHLGDGAERDCLSREHAIKVDAAKGEGVTNEMTEDKNSGVLWNESKENDVVARDCLISQSSSWSPVLEELLPKTESDSKLVSRKCIHPGREIQHPRLKTAATKGMTCEI